ncbi:ABC transporter permease [Chloroflexota bacterium]
MNRSVIAALVLKDLALFRRNRFFAVMTVVGLVFYLVIYFVMPSSVDDTIKLGIHAPGLPAIPAGVPEEGLELEAAASLDDLQTAVIEGEYVAGIALPEDFLEKLAAGQMVSAKLYLSPDVPEEMREAVGILVREMAFAWTGQALDITVTEEVLGYDATGAPVPPRDRMRPLLAIFIVIMETMFLANLIAEEVQRGTAQALLVTPMTTGELFVGKAIIGVGLAFVQALLFMAIVGGLSVQPVIIILTLLLAAIMVTGLGFLVAAVSKDFMSVLAWSMPIFIIMMVPAFGVLFPGSITGWIKVIPSYYLVDTVHRAASFGSGWGDLWSNLLILAGFCAVFLLAGILILGRKFR